MQADAAAGDDVRRRPGVEVEHHHGRAVHVLRPAPATCAARCRRGSRATPSWAGRWRGRSRCCACCAGSRPPPSAPSRAGATGTASRRRTVPRRRRVALQRERAVVQVRQEHGRDAHVVVDQVALREAGLRIHHLVEVGEAQAPSLDGHLDGLAAELLHGPERRARSRRCPRRPPPRARRVLVRALQVQHDRLGLRVDLALVRRMAQHPVVGPLGELDLRHEPRLDVARAARAALALERRALPGQRARAGAPAACAPWRRTRCPRARRSGSGPRGRSSPRAARPAGPPAPSRAASRRPPAARGACS